MLRPNAVVELVWQDETGSTASTMLNVSSSATVEEIDVSATALASILVPLTDAVLVKQRIKYRFEVTPRVEPANSTPIARSGGFYFSTDGDNPDGLVIVPSIKEEVLSEVEPTTGIGIDTDNPDVLALVDALLEGGFTTVFGNLLVELEAAYLQSRR